MDRKSQKLRTQVAAAVTTGGLVVLLAGPTSTFGLGVPSAGDATSTVQGAVQTTQQTAASTVTQVESTVQATVQAVAAPAPTAPAAAAPVQTTVQHVAAAPKQAVSRVAAPVTNRAAAVKAPSTSSQRRSSTSRPTGKAAPVRTHKPAQRSTTAPRQSNAAEAPSQCDVPVLSLLPGGGVLTGLFTLACDAVANLDVPSRIGLVPEGASGTPSLADLLMTPASGLPAPTRARSAARGAHATTGAGSRPAASAAQAGAPFGGAAIPVVTGAGRSGAVVYADGFKNASTGSAIASANAGDVKTRHHHTWFSGQSRGTELLMAILFASLSVLGGIVLWRLAVRWVIPRFA
jgi:hypothetical protein